MKTSRIILLAHSRPVYAIADLPAPCNDNLMYAADNVAGAD